MSIDQILRNELTPQQYADAVNPDRKVLSLACTGSDKLWLLANRIVRLLSKNELPGGIVAFISINRFLDKEC